MFEKEMRIMQANSETVTITLNHYEDLKLQIKQQEEKYDALLNEIKDIITDNGNFKLEKEYSKLAFGNWYFSIKTGLNEELDDLRSENERLKAKLNTKISFIDKLKSLFS